MVIDVEYNAIYKVQLPLMPRTALEFITVNQ